MDPRMGNILKARVATRVSPTRGNDKIADVSILTVSTAPLRGIATISTTNSVVELELNEETAHTICTRLERFLTQNPERKPAGLFDEQ